jgi:Predicted transcriptional regulators
MELEIFAAHLRTLRQQAGLSQEALAARLGVSAQSVSKWENAANWPEAALILPLARLLGVSADELLTEPVTREEWEKRWQEIEGEYRQRGDHAALLALAEAALKEWPGDRAFRFRRANEEYQVAALTEEETERLRLLHLSEGHFSEIVGESPENEDAGAMLVQILLSLGRREEAEALARKLPYGEKLEILLRQGKERTSALRREIAKEAFSILNLLLTEGSLTALNMAEAIIVAAGEDPQLTNYRMRLHHQKATLLCREGDLSGALMQLEAMTACIHAPLQAAGETFLTMLLYEKNPAHRRVYALKALAGEDLAPLRDDPEFRAIRERAEAMTVE